MIGDGQLPTGNDPWGVKRGLTHEERERQEAINFAWSIIVGLMEAKRRRRNKKAMTDG